jgi:hypothetical protein
MTWRQYFDPIGMRFSVRDSEVRLDTYILPLLQNSAYNQLREQVGGGTTKLLPPGRSGKTLVQLQTHLNPREGLRGEMISALSIFDGKCSFDFLGDWFLVRLDDSPVFAKLAELFLEEEGAQPLDLDPRDNLDLLFQIPLTVGVEIRNALPLGAILGAARTSVLTALPGAISWAPLEQPYKGVSIVRVQDVQGTLGAAVGFLQAGKEARPIRPAIYYALIDGAFYVSLTEGGIRSVIDDAMARKEGKAPDRKAEAVSVNSSLYLAPGAAVEARELIARLLEWAVQHQALANSPVLYPLYHAGLVGKDASQKEVEAAALKYLAFVPVSPDGAPYEYDPRTDEVLNRRHGSLAQPRSHKELAKDSPLWRFFEQVASLRADLRFREDGIHTVLTLTRKPAAK